MPDQPVLTPESSPSQQPLLRALGLDFLQLDDPEQRNRAITTSLFALSMAFWAAVFVPVFFFLGSTRLALVTALAGVLCLGTVLWLRAGRSVDTACHAVAGLVLVTLITQSIYINGFLAPAMIWLPTVPIIAILLCGWRAGLSWLLATLLSASAMWIVDRAGWLPPSDISPGGLAVLYGLALVGIITCTALLCFIFDANARVLRRKLDRARQAAELANAAKSQFVAHMSHEIRTPMNGVLGMLELMGNTQVTVEQAEYVELAKQSAGSLLRLLNDILDFSKVEAGKLELECIPFSLRAVLDDTLHAMQLKAVEKRLSLHATVAASVPDALRGDPGRLRQIIVNLVGNAIKFTEQGEVEVRVANTIASANANVASDDPPVRLQFTVRDSGMGIPPEKQHQIFEAFGQADTTTTRKFGGTGLGLTISRRLVEMMGGRLELVSQSGEGTTFRFTANFARQTADDRCAAATDVPRTEAGEISPPARPLRILLAEDGKVNQKVAQGFLNSAGHTVTIAENGRQAVEAVTTEDFDLVLMDVEMPEMDGLQATATIRDQEQQTGGHLPIIAMTAHALKGDRERFLQSGMDAYIPKPIESAELLKLVARLSAADQRDPAQAPADAGKPVDAGKPKDDGKPDDNEKPADDRKPVDDASVAEYQGVIDLPRARRRIPGGDEILQELAQALRDEALQLCDTIDQALRQGDAEVVRRAAHTLKGAAGVFEAQAVVDAARQLEQEAATESPDLGGGRRQFAILNSEVQKLVAALDVVIQRASRSDSMR